MHGFIAKIKSEITMKTRITLASVIAAAFFLSHALPAFEDQTGFECFRFCLGILLEPSGAAPLGWMYYGGFAVSNVVFIAICAMLFTSKPVGKKYGTVMLFLSLHTISWMPLNWRNLHEIKPGYYLWLLAYLALTFATVAYRRKPNPNQTSVPMNMAATPPAAHP